MKHKAILVIVSLLLVFSAAGVSAQDQYARATFAGGCFWCMEKPFDELEGVMYTTAGYTGGNVEHPH
mgnify:CR=1 FL=1